MSHRARNYRLELSVNVSEKRIDLFVPCQEEVTGRYMYSIHTPINHIFTYMI